MRKVELATSSIFRRPTARIIASTDFRRFHILICHNQGNKMKRTRATCRKGSWISMHYTPAYVQKLNWNWRYCSCNAFCQFSMNRIMPRGVHSHPCWTRILHEWYPVARPNDDDGIISLPSDKFIGIGCHLSGISITRMRATILTTCPGFPDLGPVRKILISACNSSDDRNTRTAITAFLKGSFTNHLSQHLHRSSSDFSHP